MMAGTLTIEKLPTELKILELRQFCEIVWCNALFISIDPISNAHFAVAFVFEDIIWLAVHPSYSSFPFRLPRFIFAYDAT